MNAIESRDLGKKYIISHEKQALVRHILPNILKIKDYEQFWALKDINLSIPKGASLVILGRNGAGKTTLLNILAGITFPTEGSLKVSGRVSALLSLGAGFHPELTGEENIYLNASILGLKRPEIKKKLKQIIAFSELGDFISAPLKTYSAGMYMRLGFSIAISVDADIFLIDELLAVGDLFFQKKCLEKLKELRRQDKTLLMVTQSVDLLDNLADSALLLDKGKIVLLDRPDIVASYYQRKKASIQEEKTHQKPPAAEKSKIIDDGDVKQINGRMDGWGTKMGNQDAQITRVRFLNQRRKETSLFSTGEKLMIEVEYTVNKEIDEPHFGVAIFRQDGFYCYGPNTKFDKIKIKRLRKGRGKFSIEYKRLNLLPGAYRVSVAIWEKDENFAYDYHYAFYKLEVISDKQDHGLLYLDHKWSLKNP